jgi:peptide subunit release factor 1 (eRF1)
MARTRVAPMISVYIPEKAQKQKVIERLRTLGEKRDRSLNYLVVDAILQYLDREEAK